MSAGCSFFFSTDFSDAPRSILDRRPDAETRKSCCAECFRVKCGVVKLVELLKRNEGKTLEFKRDLSSPEGILKCW